MKQKLISKLKRVALTLFAALCVGNVWAADNYYGGTTWIKFNPELSQLEVLHEYYVYEKPTDKEVRGRYIYSYEKTETDGTVTSVVATNCITGVDHPTDGVNWRKIEGVIDVPEFPLGSVLNVEYQIQHKVGDAWEPFEYSGSGIPPIESWSYDSRGILDSEGGWSNDPMQFIIAGRASLGANITGVKVKYVVGTEELGTLPEGASVVDATYDERTGNYEAKIDFGSSDIAISWSTYAVFDDNEKIFKDPATNNEVLSLTREEYSNIRYYWTNSKGDNRWNTVGNWNPEPNRSYYGYPGVVGDGGYHTSVACFTNSANVDLNAGEFRVWDYEGNNVLPRGLEFAKPTDEEEMKVSFTNGRLQMFNGGSGHSNPLLGGDGITVEFANGGIYDYSGNLAFAPGTTIIFSGNSTQPWRYNPANKGEGATTFIVRNGNVVSSYSADGDASPTHTAIIENGVWMINEVVSRGIANVTKFVDGENQAKIALGANTTGKTKTLKLTGTFEFTFSENQNSKSAYILPNQLVDGSQNATFKVDATAFKSGTKVPMVEAASATAFIPNLVVMANGVDVTSDRNAKLEWEGNTLYYKQDSQNAAKIGNTEYATLGAAVEAATDGATITVLNDCTADTACVIANKALTIDLNGKTVTGNAYPVIRIQNDASVIVKNGTITNNDYVFVLGSSDKTSAGYLEIQSGNYTGVTTVASVTKGTLKIKGGTFAVDMVDYGATYLLNCYDANYKNGTAKIEVTGGTFKGFNPANNTAEGPNTNFCKEGYTAKEVDGAWVVEKAITQVVPGAEVVTIEAESEEAALAKAALSVAAPEGIDADTYTGYFKLVATEVAAGSYAVTAVLADEVKPVIAETTADDTTKEAFVIDDDGNVTLNISNKKPGLYYGVQVLAELGADPVAVVPETNGSLLVPAEKLPDGNAAFFKVVVDFAPIPTSKAE
ncbi:MAG: hypothetical protein J6Q84_00910 [Kiritimatiellae bacterium]|nr:hypothetical protein [Kiritimatiellia bacterium]